MFDLYKQSVETIKDKFSSYTETSKASAWLSSNTEKVRALFDHYTLRDYIFEPFKSVFTTPSKTVDANVYSVITQVAIINMVLAGLPGKMGVGIWVSMALEAWMAVTIAKHVGVKIDRISDIWKYFGMLAATAGVILYGVRAALGLFFSLFSIIPGVNPLIFAELVVTNLVGVLFWIGFQEVARSGEFTIPKKLLGNVFGTTKGIVKHQYKLLKNVLNYENIKLIGHRLTAYLKGELPRDAREVNGEMFATIATGYLLCGSYEKLQGPLGNAFIESIRLRWSAQFSEDSTIEDIATRFREYEPEQLDGVINTIKGKMFEIMVTQQENLDGDDWVAKMHTDESFPGSDIIFTNTETDEQIDVSLKAVSEGNINIIEHALARYPDIPIMTTDEMADLYEGDDRVFGSSILHEDLKDITEENFDELVSNFGQTDDPQQVVYGGVIMGTTAALWPFVMAFLRKKITSEQLEKAFVQVLGENGVRLVSRISYATIFGPVFAWYLLAKGVKGLVVMAEPKSIMKVEFLLRVNK